MIKSFGDSRTEDIFHGKSSKKARTFPVDLHPVAQRKLDLINSASELRDLQVPPGNNLEALRGSLKGWHSIRINQQWRIVFRWNDGAHRVEIIDYH